MTTNNNNLLFINFDSKLIFNLNSLNKMKNKILFGLFSIFAVLFCTPSVSAQSTVEFLKRVDLRPVIAYDSAVSFLSLNSNGSVRRVLKSSVDARFWDTSGNAVTSAKKLGTTSNFALPLITNNVERMRVTENGNVGIGTNAPVSRLDIYSATGNPLRLQSLQAGATTDSLLTSSSGVVRRLAISQLGTGNFWQIGGNGEVGVRNFGTTFANDLPFITNNTERMRINIAGNVGIGTNNPTQKLEVIGNIYSVRDNGYVGIDNTNIGRLGITKKLGMLPNFAVNNNIPMIFGKYDVSNLNDLTTANYIEFGRFSNNGQFAVGTASPANSAILDVSSTTQGVLMPRMTTTQIQAIASPAEGLLVFNTTLSHVCVFVLGTWQKLSMSAMYAQ